jgi:hypothetical protein
LSNAGELLDRNGVRTASTVAFAVLVHLWR